MAMGKAIVTTTVGCEGLKVTDGKDISIADEPKEFSKKVIDLLEEGEKRRSIGNRARELSLTYDWESICGLQENAYQDVMRQYSEKSKVGTD